MRTGGGCASRSSESRSFAFGKACGYAAQVRAPELASYQRRFLRSQAHPLRPLVQVGEGGLSASLLGALEEALRDHELVKVRLREPQDKKAAARELAEASRSALCGVVGHTVILYRPHPEEPQIELPTR
ncbi:MAG: ribosome assembly RNA-binding protein YhbY [Deltaproteobacteria bacterium]|nr:ribosome assembly RNA-binding protein YhbY [Deltaproteobacteria bacterium]